MWRIDGVEAWCKSLGQFQDWEPARAYVNSGADTLQLEGRLMKRENQHIVNVGSVWNVVSCTCDYDRRCRLSLPTWVLICFVVGYHN